MATHYFHFTFLTRTKNGTETDWARLLKEKSEKRTQSKGLESEALATGMLVNFNYNSQCAGREKARNCLCLGAEVELEFQRVVSKRKMVRAFEPRPLPRESVERILANAQRGPSSGYTQGFEFLVFDGPEMTAKFWEHIATQAKTHPALDATKAETGAAKVTNAPLIIVPLANSKAYVRRYLEPDKVQVGRKTEEDWPAPYWFIDTAFASMLILLTAVDSGLGAFYFSLGPTSLDIPPFRSAFGVPDEFYPTGVMAIGYPSPSNPSPSVRRGRRAKAEVMHFARW